MKKKIILLILFLCTPLLTTHAGRKKNKQNSPNSPSSLKCKKETIVKNATKKLEIYFQPNFYNQNKVQEDIDQVAWSIANFIEYYCYTRYKSFHLNPALHALKILTDALIPYVLKQKKNCVRKIIKVFVNAHWPAKLSRKVIEPKTIHLVSGILKHCCIRKWRVKPRRKKNKRHC